jgi:hypothetical protein
MYLLRHPSTYGYIITPPHDHNHNHNCILYIHTLQHNTNPYNTLTHLHPHAPTATG